MHSTSYTVFEKVIVMPKGKQRQIKGAICNVPVNCDQTCKILPHSPERSGIILLKLRKLTIVCRCSSTLTFEGLKKAK